MSDYKRTRDALAKVLPAGDTGSPTTFEYVLDQLTPTVLELLADEAEHWSRQFGLPPLAPEWPRGEQLNLTLREAYLQGWYSASETMAARAAALRLAEKADEVNDTPV